MLDPILERVRTSRRVLPVFLLLTVSLAIGFANTAQAESGYLGVRLQDLDESLLAALDLEEVSGGVLVTDVIEDSPAEAAGLQRGDVIVEFDGRAIRSPRSLTRKVQRAEAGDSVTIDIIRKGDRRSIDVTLGEAEENTFSWFGSGDAVAPRANVFHFDDESDGPHDIRFYTSRGLALGVRVEPLNEDLGRNFGTDEGLLVLGVSEGTPAEEAGVKVGDVLLSLDGEELSDAEGLRELLADREDGDEVKLEIMRDRSREQLTATLEEGEGWAGILDEHFPGMLHRERGHGNNVFELRRGGTPRALRQLHSVQEDELQDQMKDLKKELEELRAELEKMRGN